jgi:hypothetical protein
MKRLLCAGAVLFLAAAPVTARAQGGLGIKAGLSFNTASNTGLAPGATQRSGFAVGISALTGGVIGFGVEGLYAQRGFTATTASDSRRLDYIDVPVYLRIALQNRVVTPFAYAGPQGSYELKCGTGTVDCPASDRPKFTYAGVIGGGVRFDKLGGLSVEGRYVYGLTDLKYTTVSSSESYKTRSLLLLAGFGF